MMTRRSLLASSLLAPMARPQEAVFSADVSVVNVLATVRDGKGRIVTDLTKEDFVLEEQGRRQEIRYFAQHTDLPLILGLVVDTSPSVQRVLSDERKACLQFLERVLRPDTDKAFVIQFDREVELVQDLTSSREHLDKAVDQLKGRQPELQRRNDFQFPGSPFPVPGGGGRFPGGGGRNPRTGGPTMGGRARIAGTALYDAVLLASEEMMMPQKGRKAIILITDGMDAGSKVSLEDGIEAAQRADTLVYSIRFFDKDAYRQLTRRFPGRPADPEDGKRVLESMSRETGGAEFDADKKLKEVFDRIEEELRNQYSLGYKPDKAGSKGEFREIKLTTPQKKLNVQTRRGYYAA